MGEEQHSCYPFMGACGRSSLIVGRIHACSLEGYIRERCIYLLINGANKVISSYNLPTSLTMLKSLIALDTIASTSSFAIAQRDVIPTYPITQILPVPGWNSTTDGFNSLGNLYTSSATQLSSEAVAIGKPRIPL